MIALTMSDTGTVNGASRTQDKTRTANRRDPMVWVIKPAVWVLCLAPLAWLGWLVAETIFFGGRGLTANPVEFIHHVQGQDRRVDRGPKKP